MQIVIKEYGEAILAAVVSVLVIGLIFGGLSMIGRLGAITGTLDKGIVKEAQAASEKQMKKHLDIPSDNISMSDGVLVKCGDKIFYKRPGSLIGLQKGQAKRVDIGRVYLLEGNSDNEGYDVTDQVLKGSGDDSYITFDRDAGYRLIVNITDENNIVSDYQIFVTAVKRRKV